MDTDNLSKETYKAIFYSAEQYHHNLTLQFGLLASDCNNDDDYLDKANRLIIEWKSDLENSLAEIFFDTSPPITTSLLTVLNNIEKQIHLTQTIPMEKRIFEY